MPQRFETVLPIYEPNLDSNAGGSNYSGQIFDVEIDSGKTETSANNQEVLSYGDTNYVVLTLSTVFVTTLLIIALFLVYIHRVYRQRLSRRLSR